MWTISSPDELHTLGSSRRWRAFYASIGVATLALGSIVASCEKTTTVTTTNIGQQCNGLTNGLTAAQTTCASGVCVLGYCRSACQTDAECGSGGVCVFDGSTGGCRLEREAGCSASQVCPSGLVCAIDNSCRAPCSANQACPRAGQGEICIEGACFFQVQAPDGGVPDGGTSDTLAEIQARVMAYAAAIRPGATLAEVLAFYDDAYLEDGYDRTQYAEADLAFSQFGASTNQVLSLLVEDRSAGTATVLVESDIDAPGFKVILNLPTSFKRGSDSVWRLYGNQRIASLALSLTEEKDVSPSGTTMTLQLRARVSAPAGTLSSATVSGPGINNVTFTVGDPYHRRETSGFIAGEVDSWDYETPYIGTVGSQYNFNLIPLSGTAADYTEIVERLLTEDIRLTSPTGTGLANANLGGPLTVTWLPLASIMQNEIGGVEVSFNAENAMNERAFPSDEESRKRLGPAGTSTTIQFPAMINGQPTIRAEVRVEQYLRRRNSFEGGAQTQITHHFE